MPPKPERGNSRNNTRNNYSKDDKRKPKTKSKHKMPASMIKRGSKREVVFDPEARKDHLRGFSERKRQRRAFGLAMQKVKDRKAKIEQRASEKKHELERVEEAEQQKEQWMEEIVRMNNYALDSFGGGKDDDSDEDENSNTANGNGEDNSEAEKKQTEKQIQQAEDVIDTKVYDDEKTEKTWGGQVTVTTSVVELDDDSDGDSLDDNINNARSAKSVDKQQRYAGNVARYMDRLKGNMPAKKNSGSGSNTKRKGEDGAAGMKGVGGSGHLKIASKLLHKSKDRSLTAASGKGSKSKKGRKGKR